jgi:hypothetical protein
VRMLLEYGVGRPKTQTDVGNEDQRFSSSGGSDDFSTRSCARQARAEDFRSVVAGLVHYYAYLILLSAKSITYLMVDSEASPAAKEPSTSTGCVTSFATIWSM